MGRMCFTFVHSSWLVSPSDVLPHHLQRPKGRINLVKCKGNRTIEILSANPPISNHLAQKWLFNFVESEKEPSPTARSRKRQITPSSEFDGGEAEAGSEGDHQETDAEAASNVSATPQLDFNKSASEGYATPTPKGKQAKQSRNVPRH